MKRSQILVVQLPGSSDPLPVIAACRAGAAALLDCQYDCDRSFLLSVFSSLATRCRGSVGLKIAADRAGLVDVLADEGLPAPDPLILTLPFGTDPEGVISRYVSMGIRILLECLHPDDVRLAERCGVAGIVAKGNEAGGLVASESSFILLQRLLGATALPVWVHGGIGPHTAAACMAAGAAGVVLDSQCALARESSLSPRMQRTLASFDGTQTRCLELPGGRGLRIATRIDRAAADAFLGRMEELIAGGSEEAGLVDRVAACLGAAVTEGPETDRVWPLGQDIGLAAGLAERHVTVGGIVGAVCDHVNRLPELLARGDMLREDAPLARSHRTRYPIVQGPMARISDTADFALAVAEAGGLPFLAAAMLRPAELEPMLAATASALAGRSWGVGLLGFLPPARYREQEEVLLRTPPPYALIAGGRPEQARRLEEKGIATYLHVPTPGLLRMFLRSGMQRFVFEGREAGGHVAPLSSFVLWEQMIGVLEDHLREHRQAAGELHVLFAGGIHDDLSAAMVAALAAPLDRAGVRVGLQLGSVYLFTEEIVRTGALHELYRREVLAGDRTVLLETGLGHASRCVVTPFTTEFLRRRAELRRQGLDEREIRDRLELLNLGKLRLAAKGLDRRHGDGGTTLVRVDDEEQRRQGVFMVGQLTALHREVTTVARVHHNVILDGHQRLAALVREQEQRKPRPNVPPADIAIIGMAAVLPGASSVADYWDNILLGEDAVTEVPPDRWDWRLYFDEDPEAEDRCYSRWGAFIDELVFDPVAYGMPPASLPYVEPLQLLSLEMARRALADAGYSRRPFAADRTSVILGISGAGELGQLYSFRAALPMFFGDAAHRITDHFQDHLPHWSEDSFPGILTNVTAGRIANRLDLGGTNYTVDAACASSLAAVHLAVQELERGSSRMVLAGAADCLQNPFAYLCFSKTRALSPRGRCRTFDRQADGIVLGEGVTMLVLKRLADAEADGDTVHAVIRGVGASSDGRDRSLTAPRREGQLAALKRAYEQAGFSPATVGLIEAHGTGTVLGDQVELEALSELLHSAGAQPGSCGVGSVKSMIGHTKSTAGIAGLIKAVLALRHRVLPPTLGVEHPNRVLEDETCPLYVNTATRPWIRTDGPRRAGVSALGFGGTNFHVVLEEYRDNLVPPPGISFRRQPAELFLFRAADPERLRQTLSGWRTWLADTGSPPAAAALALGAWQEAAALREGASTTLALVAASAEELAERLGLALDLLGNGAEINDPRGIYWTPDPLAGRGRVAFLFPGQGSQHVDMLADLAVRFPGVHDLFARATRLLRDRLEEPLARVVYPPPAFSDDMEKRRARALARTRYAQPAMGSADLALSGLLTSCNVRPDMAAGHSYGEYAALCAAGVFSFDDLILLSEARGRFIVESARPEPGTMAAVRGDRDLVTGILAGRPDVWIANLNAPEQTIISGLRKAVEEAVQDFTRAGIAARTIPVACAFHSPVVAGAVDRLQEFLAGMELGSPAFPVYSNRSAAPYPADREAIVTLLGEHLVHGVEFIREIEAMYDDGARLFVEAGPGRVLSGLVGGILGDRPHLALPTCLAGRPGMVTLLHCLGRLAAHGVDVDLAPLFADRDPEPVSPGRPAESPDLPAAAWLVGGGRARPLHRDPADLPGPIRPMDPVLLCPGGTTAASPRSAPAPLAAGAAPAGSGDQVLVRYQELMQTFLETQAGVMKAWLTTSPAGVAPAAAGPVPEAAPEERAGTGPAPDAQEEAAADRAGERATRGTDIRSILLAIVSERTGYPVEMLNPDLDMEGELGIDSIKRVEILGVFAEHLADLGLQESAPLERMRSARTLADILACLEGTGAARTASSGEIAEPSGKTAPPPAQGGTAQAGSPREAAGTLPRFVLTAAPRPPGEGSGCALPADGWILLTDDGRGVARALAERIREQGGRAGILALPPADGPAGADSAPLVEELRHEHGGQVAGLVHLAPLAASPSFVDMDLAAWQRRIGLETGSLFRLLQAVAPDLRRKEGAPVLAATAMGGCFGIREVGPGFPPGQGGVCGLLKTVAAEWPGTRVRTVDLDPALDRDRMARLLMEELLLADPAVEVGWSGRDRFAPTLEMRPPAGEDEIVLDRDAVLLVTGGARGITALAALELARRYRPTLVLVGSSPLPESDESDATAGLEDEAAIKGAIIARAREAGEQVDLAGVERRFRRLLREREMRANLAAMEATGARVIYRRADVRGPEFAALLAQLYDEFGRIDGVIHGAGIIEDKLLVDKRPDSFARVVSTKADSVFHLGRGLRPDSLRFLVLFSSVAGRFGNPGQCDYTAVNEIVNKTALLLDAQWPCRVVAVNWGPWAREGMVSPALERQFAERGVRLIDPDQGVAALCDEIVRGRKGEVEVTIGDGPWGVIGG